VCSCRSVNQVISYWNTDLRRGVGTAAQTTNYQVTNYEMENCPFGTTIAALDAWRLVRRIGLGL